MNSFGKPSTGLVLEVEHRIANELEGVHAKALEPWTGFHRMNELVRATFSRDPIRVFNAIRAMPIETNEVLRLKARLLKVEETHRSSWFFLDDGSRKAQAPEGMLSVHLDGTTLDKLIGAMLEVGLITDKADSEGRKRGLSEPWQEIYCNQISRLDQKIWHGSEPELEDNVQHNMAFLHDHSPEDQDKLMKENGLRAGSLEEILDFCLDEACRAIIKANDVRAAVCGALLPEDWRGEGTTSILLPNLYYGVDQREATVLSRHQRLLLMVNHRGTDFLTVRTTKPEDWQGTIFAVKV